MKSALKELQEKLNAQKNLLKGCSREINEANAEKAQITKDMSNVQLQVQELEHKVAKCNKDTNDAVKLVNETVAASAAVFRSCASVCVVLSRGSDAKCHSLRHYVSAMSRNLSLS